VTEAQSKEGGNKQTQTQNIKRRTDADRATITLPTPLQFLRLQVGFLFTCCMLSFALYLHFSVVFFFVIVAPDIAAALKKSKIAEKEQIPGILFF
jgi:hypothetical protein